MAIVVCGCSDVEGQFAELEAVFGAPEVKEFIKQEEEKKTDVHWTKSFQGTPKERS